MKQILRGIAISAMAGLALIGRAQDTNVDQSQYPTIIQQPNDQCVPVGVTATFSVVATNADSYQWYKNNALMDSATNSSVTILSAGINDVGYYSAAVMNNAGAVPTRSASLNVYTTSSTTTTSTTTSTFTKSRLSTQSMSTMTTSDLGGGGEITVFGLPVVSGGGGTGSCPGRYSGYVNFTKPAAQGWGWAPTVGMTHTATDTNRPDTKIQFMGQYGDTGCAPVSVTVSNPISPVYRFSIFFPTNCAVPTNAYPITLDGFDP
jgi:hypothetical protein